MHLGAHVLLPEGFDEHPEARYPLVIFHGHFTRTFGGFREQPPDPDLKPVAQSEFALGAEKKLGENLSASLRFVYHRTDTSQTRSRLVVKRPKAP